VKSGGRDREARPEEARALYGRVRDHGRLVWFDLAGHESLFACDPSRYRDAVRGILLSAAEDSPRVQPSPPGRPAR
ncbi:hypothetical protein ACSFB1_12575, partial [Glaesserella parasuis]|uniref:hypothetical protein n=1 Tax=Glaesserella parasuis TaxID=738 RepID=UPI003F36AADB